MAAEAHTPTTRRSSARQQANMALQKFAFGSVTLKKSREGEGREREKEDEEGLLLYLHF